MDAAARLIERSGLVALTTNLLATEAQASIGTVYEYFPNKEAALAALLERYRERLQVAIQAAFTPRNQPWDRVVSRAVDAFYRYYRQEPGYRQLWLGSQLAPELVATGARWADDFTAWVAEVMGEWAPKLAIDRRRVIARVVVHLLGALLTVAVSAPHEQQPSLVQETKLVLRRYLGAYMT